MPRAAFDRPYVSFSCSPEGFPDRASNDSLLEPVVFAQGQAQLMRLAPRHAQSAGTQAPAHQLNGCNAPAHDPRRPAVGPKFAERANHAVAIGMVDTLVPGTGALRKLGIVADRVD